MPTVVFPGPGAGGNLFEQMLGDLLKLMGGASSGRARVELARTLAQGVASGGEPEANVDPAQRIRFEELTHIAELHVAELTGLTLTPTGAALEVATVAPGAWAGQTVEDWRFLLDAMSSPAEPPGPEAAPPGRPAPPSPPPGPAEPTGPTGYASGEPEGPDVAGLGLTDIEGGLEAGGGAADVLGRWMAVMGPVISAVQLGSAVGHLARRTLGPYEVPIPRDRKTLLVVPANVDRFADDWSLERDEVRLWVCLRSVTTHAVLSKPHVAARLRELLERVVRGMTEESAGLTERFRDLDLSGPDALERLLGNPEEMLRVESSPARRHAAEDLAAVVGALLGYVEHVLDLSAIRLLGGRRAIAEAWRRRLVDREGPERSVELLLGLDLGPTQLERGTAFVNGVLTRAGDDGLARLWSRPDTLPTPAELDAPGLWLERIEIPGADASA
jgi:putative hydrolase